LSGCNTVTSLFGIGKYAVLKALHSGISLSLVMSEARMFLESSKLGKGKTATNFNMLPTTNESFAENIFRELIIKLIGSL
jgi:hypothetical protein